MSRIHFIAIGGSIMHNLAIALKQKGESVTGSDDEIFDPARSRLLQYNLLPPKPGWFPGNITRDLDFIILGMHAKQDNPELLMAVELKIPIYSYPEFIYRHSALKNRVVIAGSHGKSTITALIIHVLSKCNVSFDYLVGTGMKGIPEMVKLSDESGTMVMEGDEYYASVLDKVPKFLLYRHNIGLLSGIAWDHINVFPSRDNYEEQFRKFVANTPPSGKLIYNEEDPLVKTLAGSLDLPAMAIPYRTHPYQVFDGVFHLQYDGKTVPLLIFGRHNMQNIAGAKTVLENLGISEDRFMEAVATFPGADRRLEILVNDKSLTIYRDFAHAPSKVKASVSAARERQPGRVLTAILELHTYSSLNIEFLPEYKGALEKADLKFIYLDDHSIQLKKMKPVSDMELLEKFDDSSIRVIRSAAELTDILKNLNLNNLTLLFMSSGNFGGVNLKQLFAKKIYHDPETS